MPQDESEIWGDVFVEVPDDKALVEDGTQWVPIGHACRTAPGARGQLVMTMHTEPLCWRDHTWHRRLMIVRRKGKDPSP